jgi:hypothetical protein
MASIIPMIDKLVIKYFRTTLPKNRPKPTSIENTDAITLTIRNTITNGRESIANPPIELVTPVENHVGSTFQDSTNPIIKVVHGRHIKASNTVIDVEFYKNMKI